MVDAKAASSDGKCRTQRELAAALGVAQKTVSKWVNDARWPFRKRGPWDAVAVGQWRVRALDVDPAAIAADPERAAAATDLKAAKEKSIIQVNLRRAQLLQLKIEITKGEHVPREDVRVMLTERARVLRATMESWPQLVADCATVDEARDELDRAIAAALEEYARNGLNRNRQPAAGD